MKIELLFDAKATLGEGPVWDSRTQSIYWVDILDKRIYCNGDILIQLDDLIGCIAPCKNGGLILAFSGGRAEEGRLSFASLELDSLHLTFLSSLRNEPSNNRFNDGKCDPCGRFLTGTMDMAEEKATGELYSLDGNSNTKLLGNVRISNGLTWSPDYKTLYYIDTPTREVQSFDYDLETGAIANPRSAVCIPASFG